MRRRWRMVLVRDVWGDGLMPSKDFLALNPGYHAADMPGANRRRAKRSAAGSEHDEQVALFRWSAFYTPALPELALLLAIPNGGKRDIATARKLRAEGVKAGVPDLLMPVARMGHHGFWIELKYGPNRTTIEQDVWLTALRAEGYAVDVSYGWQEAAHKIVRYLGREPRDFGL